jgi:NAD(P)H-flavin reductase
MPIRRFTATVSLVRNLTHDVREITLRLLDPPAIAFKAGQFISFEVINPQIQRPVVRPYSIASSPSRNDIDLVLNLVPGGPGSSYLFSLKEGDETRFTGPAGSFYLREDLSRAHLFVATGTGIAPLRSMLHALVERGGSRPVILYWGVRSQRDLYYQDELTRLANAHPNFSFLTTLSRPESGWAGERGRVTRLVEERIASVQDLAVYLCGNGGMIKEVSEIIRKKGLCPIYREKYYDDAGEPEI